MDEKTMMITAIITIIICSLSIMIIFWIAKIQEYNNQQIQKKYLKKQKGD